MNEYTFEGTATITKKFSIKIPAANYEKAEELASDLLRDVDNSEYFETGNDEVEIDIETYESTVISPQHHLDRYEVA